MIKFFCTILLAASYTSHAAEPTFVWQEFAVPADTRQMVAADLNGDGLQELIAVSPSKLRVYVHGTNGFDFDSNYHDIRPEARAVGWDISTNHNGRTGLLLLLDGKALQRWSLHDGGGDGTALQSETIANGLPGYLPGGLNRLRMAQDINADGLDDLVIPGIGQLHLYLNNGSRYAEGSLSIQSDFAVRTSLRTNISGDRLESRMGQAVRIPLMELRDLNNDGRNDLISSTEERLAVFLAEPAASDGFPARPSFELDIAAIEERLGEFDIDRLDFSNLTGILALGHEQILEDADGDGIADLLLREGGKVSLFSGTAQGMDFSQPTQVLRSGGNVLGAFLHDEDGDGRKDLWLWRVEPVSVGDVFLWLALSGSVAIEAFIYPNEGRRFARRPARRLSVDLRFPSVIRMATSFRTLVEEARATTSSTITPHAQGRINPDADGTNGDGASPNRGGVRPNTNGGYSDADGLRQDLLVLLNDRIEVFLNAITAAPARSEFLGTLGYSRDQDDYEIDIRDIIDRIALGTSPALEQIASRAPDMVWPLPSPTENGDILLAPLNRDPQDDILIITTATQSHVKGHLLLSGKEPDE